MLLKRADTLATINGVLKLEPINLNRRYTQDLYALDLIKTNCWKT